MATLSVAHHRRQSQSQTMVGIKLAAFLTTEGAYHDLQPAAKAAAHPVPLAEPFTYTVTATAYQPVVNQTDNEPFTTADNSTIKPHYSSRTRWLALSRDLLARWGGDFQYGDQVSITGISPTLDGVYTVHDTMNKRHRHCLDILTHTREKIDICTKNVKIKLVAATSAPDSSLAASPMRAISLARLKKAANASERGLFLAKTKRKDYFASAIL
ncbi:hypothetical protein [Hymenobacter cheonanensis]|uniref:hypothetical protein n=1 Tax=Hymenobacter sp. CA2-7 TaxID=3063993 RepID=UPI002713D963|nr:hypothetical protein [Hymenobacter sp. CA2-7]MDO7885953.1 hypothetical protein [Hymenobacter sp. CA2-7]